MEASLTGYFELEEADKVAEDTSPTEETAPTDDITTLTDANLSESAPPADETENTAIGGNADYASASEDTVSSYTAPEQTGVSGTETAEDPPEGLIQNTQ